MLPSTHKTVLILSLSALAGFNSSCKHDPKEVPDIGIEQAEPTPLQIEVPQGIPPLPVPDENPLTVEGVALGRKLFYDERLSQDQTQSCASCHIDENGYADPNRFSIGVQGLSGTRNAMSITNLAYAPAFFWDGRASTLEIQALEPVPNPLEMNLSWPVALERLNADELYRKEFKLAFGVDWIDSTDVAKAIAQFERTMISGNSKYDKFKRGEADFTPLELEGLDLFRTERADCFHCHAEPLFMGFEYLSNGVQGEITDPGLGGITGRPQDLGLFKPPTLRNIEYTAPYMHDGRFNTLEEVVEFYNSGVHVDEVNISPLMKKSNRYNGDLDLTPRQKEALVAFLKTLSDEEFISNPKFQDPDK